MKLRALDQINVSAVQSDSLRPGQEFTCTEELGSELLKKHPAVFEELPADEPAEKEDAPPPNKAEPAPPNKAAPKRKTKAEA